jgi:hypothetical protein
VQTLLPALLDASDEFRRLWSRHDVAVRRSDTKRIVSASVGFVEVDCEVLLTPEHGQRLVVLTARPGTSAQDKLDLCSVLGTQTMDAGAGRG